MSSSSSSSSCFGSPGASLTSSQTSHVSANSFNTSQDSYFDAGVGYATEPFPLPQFAGSIDHFDTRMTDRGVSVALRCTFDPGDFYRTILSEDLTFLQILNERDKEQHEIDKLLQRLGCQLVLMEPEVYMDGNNLQNNIDSHILKSMLEGNIVAIKTRIARLESLLDSYVIEYYTRWADLMAVNAYSQAHSLYTKVFNDLRLKATELQQVHVEIERSNVIYRDGLFDIPCIYVQIHLYGMGYRGVRPFIGALTEKLRERSKECWLQHKVDSLKLRCN